MGNNTKKEPIIDTEERDEESKSSDDVTENLPSWNDFKLNSIPKMENPNRKKKLYIIFPTILVVIFVALILKSNWNVIMGNHYCKIGNYSAAMTYYAKDIDAEKASQKTKNKYEALSAYEEGKKAYDSDNMELMSDYIKTLNETTSKYPTKQEILELENKYDLRNGEMSEYDAKIKEIEKLFSDSAVVSTSVPEASEKPSVSPTTSVKASPTNTLSHTQSPMSTATPEVKSSPAVTSSTAPVKTPVAETSAVPTKKEDLSNLSDRMNKARSECEELEKLKLSETQKEKVSNLKAMASFIIKVKTCYDEKNYDGLVNIMGSKPENLKNYGINNEIDRMAEEAKKKLKEQKAISEGIQAAQKYYNEGHYEKAITTVDNVKKKDLSNEDYKEAERIKTASQQKLEEQKTAELKKEIENKQIEINNAIKIDTVTLRNEFETDADVAEKKYAGKKLIVTGNVINFMSGYVVLRAGNQIRGTIIFLKDEYRTPNVSIGQTISVFGKCTGHSMECPLLEDGIILN